jgi:PAS domain S-box-containing protein
VNDPATLQLAQIALLGEAADNLTGVAIFVWDEDRNYVAVNDAACELVGRARSEILEMKVGDLTANRASPHFENVQHGSMHTGSLEIQRTDGAVAVDWMTCHTKVAGLPYMLSLVWRKEPS